MVCSACQDKPVDKACNTCGKLPPVLQIKSEECPVLFHTVELEGTREDNPPYIGMYKNTLLTYTADSAKYLFNSDGIYSIISGAVKFDEIVDRPKYDGVEMTSETDIPDVNKAVAVESAARAAADAEIESKLNNTVMYDLEMNADATSVEFVEDKKNLFTGTTSSETDTIPLASETQAGILNAAGYQSIKNSQDRLDALAGGAVSVPNLPAEPTQAQLTNAWETATGLEEVFNRASIFDSTNGKNWTYFDNTSAWEVTGEVNQTITLENFSLGQAGLIVGDNTDGKVYAEQDGTGSVYGWDALKSRVSNAESNITTLGTDKQDKLTAGTNITIDANNVISANGAVYTAGQNIQISSNNVISATDTTYNDFTGTDGSSAGTAGLVPAPTISDADKYLKSDGTWATVSSGGGGIPTNATFWGQSYNSSTNSVTGSITFSNGSYVNEDNGNLVLANSSSAGSVLMTAGGSTLASVSPSTGVTLKSGNLQIHNVTDPTAAQDAATKNYVDTAIATAGVPVYTPSEFNTLWQEA